MAQTFIAVYPAVAFAAAKNMAAILNTHATEVLKIRRVVILNSQTAAVTGVLCSPEMRIYRGTATLTGSTAITPVSLDSTNTAPASATYGHAGTIGGTSYPIGRVFWSSDEAAISTATSDELETFVPLNTIYDWAPHSDIQPITLRQNEMFLIYNNTGAAGLLDTIIFFTKE